MMVMDLVSKERKLSQEWKFSQPDVPTTQLGGKATRFLIDNGLDRSQFQVLWSKTPLTVRLKKDGPETLAIWSPEKGWQIYGTVLKKVKPNLTEAMMVEACR